MRRNAAIQKNRSGRKRALFDSQIYKSKSARFILTRSDTTGGIFYEQQGSGRFQFATQRVSHFAMGGPCGPQTALRVMHASELIVHSLAGR